MKGRKREERKEGKKKENKEEKSEEKTGKKGKRKEKAPKKKPPNRHPTPTTRLVSSYHHHSHPSTRLLLPSSKLFLDAPPASGRTWLWPMNLWNSD
jgi:hypothetical protein